MLIVGVDPGITGAVAIIHPDGRTADIYDTPFNEITKNGKNRKEYSESEMARIFHGEAFISDAITEGKIHLYIEKVHSMPGEGAVGAFSFGKGFGIWLGIAAALKIPYTLITPQAWKKELMQGMSDKDAARGRAQQLFPEKSAELRFKKDIGRADALLIAYWGRNFGSGKHK
jgi:crossover junction endodeoxyribonuclease RuvC